MTAKAVKKVNAVGWGGAWGKSLCRQVLTNVKPVSIWVKHNCL